MNFSEVNAHSTTVRAIDREQLAMDGTYQTPSFYNDIEQPLGHYHISNPSHGSLSPREYHEDHS